MTELQKQISWNEPKYKLYFYRDHNGNEIDLIIEGPRKELVAIEIKSNETMKLDFFKTIRYFAADHKADSSGVVFCIWGDKRYHLGKIY